MDITKLQIGLNALSAGGPLVAVEVKEVYAYENGKKTGTIEAYKVDIIAIQNNYERFTVRIANKPLITEEQLGKACVTFENFAAKIYRDFKNNSYALSCKADSVTIVTEKR